MSAVHYRFKSESTFSKIVFDGLHITLGEIKKFIYQQRKLGRSENVDLMIKNFDTGAEFHEDSTLILKNTKLIVIRVPGIPEKFKKSQFSANKPTQSSSYKNLQADLTKMSGSEEDKIFAMMMQSTVDYNANPYVYRSTTFSNPPPNHYVCRRCRIPGHWIQKCPLNPPRFIRFDPKTKMTGIPMSMRFKKSESPQVVPQKSEFFDKENSKNLICEICSEFFRNPTLTPCCRKTFCYDCIESAILRSDEHGCPTCDEKYLMLSQLEMNENIGKEIFKLRNRV